MPMRDQRLASEWIPVCLTEQLGAEPKQVKVMEETIVLFRTASGIHALKDICVHRGAPLSLGKVKEDCLVCPYHGWAYDEQGKCVHIPQIAETQAIPLKTHTANYACTEAYGIVWVKLSASELAVPYFKEASDPKFSIVSIGPYPVNASAPRLIENFLDVGHLAFLHEGYLGDPSFPYIQDYNVSQVGESLVSDEIVVIQPNGDGRGKPVANHYVYEISSPICVRFHKKEKDSEETLAIMLVVLPEEEKKSSAFFIMGVNFPVDPQQLISFQELIFQQDKAVLENQKPELLPLDLQAEMHLKADKVSIAYRQYLTRSGTLWGTKAGNRLHNNGGHQYVTNLD